MTNIWNLINLEMCQSQLVSFEKINCATAAKTHSQHEKPKSVKNSVMLSSTVRSDVELRASLLVVDSEEPRVEITNIVMAEKKPNWCLASFCLFGVTPLLIIVILTVALVILGPIAILGFPDLKVFIDNSYRDEVDIFLKIGITLHNTFGTLILSLASVSSIAALGAAVWIGKVAARCILTAVVTFCRIAFFLPLYIGGWAAMYHCVSGEASTLKLRKEILYSIVFLTIAIYLCTLALFAYTCRNLLEKVRKAEQARKSNDATVMSETGCGETVQLV